MAGFKEFDPTAFIDTPQLLGDVTEALDASAFKMQRALHRQRVGAARARLRRAEAADAEAADREALTFLVAARETRLAAVDEQFAVANIKKPLPDPEAAQVAGVVTGETGAPPYTAALLDGNRKVIAGEQVRDNGAFTLSLAEAEETVRLQVSDSKKRILFRDAEPFDLPLGALEFRRVPLGDPVKPPQKPPEQIKMPDLSGLSEDVACAILVRLGVREISVSTKTDSGPSGVVIGQAPEARAVLNPPEGASLVISISGDGGGTDVPIQLPNYIGRQLDEVRRVAKKLGLVLDVTERKSDEPSGEVLDQTPAPGTRITPPVTVSVTVSRGSGDERRIVTVPKLAGRKLEAVREAVEKLGLELVARHVPSERPEGMIVSQSPEAGEEVTSPSTVTVTVSGLVQPIPPVPHSFIPDLVWEMEKDDRLENLELDDEGTAGLLRKLGIRNRDDAESAIELDNAELKEKARLRTLTQARTLRSILRAAAEKLD